MTVVSLKTDEGVQPKVRVTFTRADVAFDPSTVRFTLKKPSEIVTTYIYGVDAEVVRESTGVYYLEPHLDEPGRWEGRVDDGVPAVSSAVGRFYFIVDDDGLV